MIKKIQGSTESTYLSPSLSRKVLDDSFSSLKPEQKKKKKKTNKETGSQGKHPGRGEHVQRTEENVVHLRKY